MTSPTTFHPGNKKYKVYTDKDSDGKTEIITDLNCKLEGKAFKMEVKVDPGSETNCIPLSHFRCLFPQLCREDGSPKEKALESTLAQFEAYNGGILQAHDWIIVPTQDITRAKKFHPVRYYVVDREETRILISHATAAWLGLVEVKCKNKAPKIKRQVATVTRIQSQSDKNICLLGPSHPRRQSKPPALRSCPGQGNIHKPGSVTVNSVEDILKLYPNSFDRLGSLKGEYDIKVDPTVPPVQHARRKVPIESKVAIKETIDYMVQQDILEPQIEPTPWVSSVTYPVKPSGEVRPCLDAKDLNKAIIRENHKLQTVEEIAHQLAGVVVFMKADALKAFLQVHLTEASSKLLVINTHKERYQFKRMPFGAKMSQDVFQMKMDLIMEKCPGVISIHDDIVIYGTSDQDHDANFINLLNVAQLEGLVLNSKKLELKQPRVSFFGVEYSADGMHTCPKKIQGITEMILPTDKQQLASFIGMVMYMGNFVPHLSHHTEPLRAMLKQDIVFHWDEMANTSFQRIKDLIAKTASQPLRYYDHTKLVTVQANASQRGLGACLIQDGQPIAFASKSLTDTETRYANIERELLAIVFAWQHFNTYILGRPFTVESDHKPLEMIHQKSLASAPPRLQIMLLQLQRYNVTIRYKPGKDMLLTDAMSRCPSYSSEEIKLDMRVDYVAFNKAWIAKLKKAIWEDLILSIVYQLTQQGWPHQRRHTPQMAWAYWDFRDELSTDEGLLLKGPCIVIPSCLREEYRERLHHVHLSATKVQQNARQHLYWPELDADIVDYTKRCQECIK